ncbi:MAG: hypothetical protein BGO30_05040 [Bacteroidetes bacterium 41-46]|nr:MAG: hypothetical protein BGO30_05040 [Bacteroidetes bacterium 41-46]
MNCKYLVLLSATLLLYSIGRAQGPELDFFYSSSTEIPWSDSYIKFKSGSKMRFGFFPLASAKSAPFGTDGYNKDVNIDKALIFLPSVNHREGFYGEDLEIKDRFILYCPDFEKIAGNNSNLNDNINTLIAEGVAGIALFSDEEESPIIDLEGIKFHNSEIPIIAISRSTAHKLLNAGGYYLESVYNNLKLGKLPTLKDPIYNISISFTGKFCDLQTEHCTIRFNKERLDSLSVIAISNNNERALSFLYNLFSELNPLKERQLITYFSDYDEKLFYTNHWGKGLAAGKAGIFSIYDNTSDDYALAVHELTHIMFNTNWGRQTSFLNEGIAMYAESVSVNSSESNRITRNFLERGLLLPLEKLTKLQIGADKDFTQMGYAASGSFVDFLINRYGLKNFHKLWMSGEQWKTIYGKELATLEKEWHNFIFEKTDLLK